MEALQEENKRLKQLIFECEKKCLEENERLEEELHAYKNTEYDDIQNIQELTEEIEKLKKENEKLNKENEKLKKENEMLKERMDYLRAVQATHIDDINDTHAKYRDMVLTLKTQKNKLSKKNTELRKEIETLKTKELRMRGDETLDNWVRDTYGNDYDWSLLSTMTDEEREVAHELLQKFVVIDDNGDSEIGIAIVKN